MACPVDRSEWTTLREGRTAAVALDHEVDALRSLFTPSSVCVCVCVCVLCVCVCVCVCV